MATRFKLIYVLVPILLLTGCDSVYNLYNTIASKVGFSQRLPAVDLVIEADEGDVEITAEVADSPEERDRGLMDRGSLNASRGMWFAFDDEAERRFWMKNMEISLDMLFLNKDREIRKIYDNVAPCEENATNADCARYSSVEAARYILEVPAGFVTEHGIAVGDVVREVREE